MSTFFISPHSHPILNVHPHYEFLSKEIYDASCRHFARELRAAVVSVEYRLAPEHPFPAQLDDATTALRYLMREAPRWSIDRTRIAVAGPPIQLLMPLDSCGRVFVYSVS